MSDKQIGNAYKWSVVTEIIAKFISPLTNMILARVLTPDIFGIVATITMIISFASLFADAGFQKFIIQHEFKNKKEFHLNLNVAFTSNFIMSIFFWGVIIVFRDNISMSISDKDIGGAIALAGVVLPISALSSIQIAVFRRNFHFKDLFVVRFFFLLVPLFVTVPLAIITKDYWSLIIGTIVGELSNSAILTAKSKWKPMLYFDFHIFRGMFNYTFWILIESIVVWMSSYVGVFIIGSKMNTYYVGLYKTSLTTVTQIFGLITSSTSNVLFSSLSRLQNKKEILSKEYCSFIKCVAIFIAPIGVVIWMFRDLITVILLGNQWSEASFFIGLWGIMSSFSLLYGTYCNGVYNAISLPQLSVLANGIQVIVMIPLLATAAIYGFPYVCYAMCVVRVVFIFTQFIFMSYYIGVSPISICRNTIWPYLASVPMYCIGEYVIKSYDGSFVQLFCVILCCGIYLITVSIPREYRSIILSIMKRF